MGMPQELVTASIIFAFFLKFVSSTCQEPISLGIGKRSAFPDIKNGTAFHNHSATETIINNGTGWCATFNNTPYLTIEFDRLITLSKVATQGATFNNHSYFVSGFRLQFGYGDRNWYDYKKNGEAMVFQGNTDAVTIVNNSIQETMTKHVRIHPVFPEGKKIICLRTEFYGCQSGLKPMLLVDKNVMVLKDGETGSFTCNASGQVGMVSSWQKPSNDARSTEHILANTTSGIFHTLARKLSISQLATVPTFHQSCALDKEEAVVICKSNYTCIALYTLDSSLKSAKGVNVDFKKGITYDVVINSGRLSPVHVNIGEDVNLDCSARTQDVATIKWYHKTVKAWTANSVETNKLNHLSFYRKNTFTFKPSSAEVINSLPCVKAEGNELRCKTKFSCKVSYNFNESLFEEKQVDVSFFVRLPSQPDSPKAACSYDKCDLSWSPANPGGVAAANIYYSVSINGSVNSLQAETFDVTALDPFRKYKALIKTLVKKSNGTIIWTSEATSLEFETKPSKVKAKPTILSAHSTSSSITVAWQEAALLPESGLLLKYDLSLVQTKYGNRDINLLELNQINRLTNVNKTTTQFTFNKLKAWSEYQLKIRIVNNHHMPGPNTELTLSTKESAPTAPPSNIQGYPVKSRCISLGWDEPAFITHNGVITHYKVKWKAIKARRGRRAVGDSVKLVERSQCKTTCRVDIVGLEPFQEYGFQVAAKTAVAEGKLSYEKIITTAQAAPSAPHSLSYNENRTTFFLLWKAPTKPNGILKEYEVELKAEGRSIIRFTESTDLFYDTKMNSSDSIEFKVRGYTADFHNVGGLAGEWSVWATAKRRITPVAKGPASSSGAPVLAIVLSFFVVLILLIVLIVVFFVFYRRREKGRRMQKLEVEMDSVAEAENDDINVITGEDVPLTRHLGSHEAVDVPAEEHTHLPVPVGEFNDYVSRMNESDGELFLNQYRYELMSGKCCSTEVALRNENKPKNRYVNIVAYDHSRVILKPEGGRRPSHHHGETDYFNANYIEGYCPLSTSKYIACQGPMQSIFTDFWRMVWQENSSVIVMLTNLEEGGKVKCDQYWPSEGARKYGPITVRFRNCDQTADYLIRYFEIEKGTGKDKEKRSVVQLHFISWPDNHIPELATAILSLRRRVRHHYCGGSPMVVHCSAGVGRTGCFILVDAMLERIDSGEGNVDIFNYLQYMRTRRINMVQTPDQYIFAHTAVLEYITFGDNEISAVDFEVKLRDLKINRGIEQEFRLIESTSPDLEALDNCYKVLLKDGKFIDVFYIDGYKQRDAFFLCNSPSENMAPDFWRMLVEQSCHTVVMLNRLEEQDNYKYWPDIYTHQKYGDQTVTLTSEQQNGNIATRKFKISSAETPDEEFEVQHLQFLEWHSDYIPNNKNSILTLMSLVEKSRQNYGNGPVLVHSGNGAGRSGTFIAISNSTERLKVEQIIDVLQCVRAIRAVVPIAVSNAEQYEFIYEMIRTYLEGFETYSNFTDAAFNVEH